MAESGLFLIESLLPITVLTLPGEGVGGGDIVGLGGLHNSSG